MTLFTLYHPTGSSQSRH